MNDTNASASSLWATADIGLDTAPASSFWRDAPAIAIERDITGVPRPASRTLVRSRWTAQHLYFLFACPYAALHLRPSPRTDAETYALWDWDVAEVFLGADPAHPRRYFEFEVSPQGEWVDLAVDLDNGPSENGWTWQSQLTAAARIDAASRAWYGFLRIPFASLGVTPHEGLGLRSNFFRCEGHDPGRLYLAWQPTMCETFHVPERFGTLMLAR